MIQAGKYLGSLLIIFLLSAGKSAAQEFVELPLPNSNQIVVKYMFRVGSIHDFAGKPGLNYLTAQVIAEGGTKRFSSSTLKDFIYPYAAEIGVTADKEVTTFTFRFPVDFAPQMFQVMSDLMHAPLFDESDFNRVRSNISNYLEESLRSANDEEFAKKYLETSLYQSSNFEHIPEGTISSLANMGLENIQSHFEKYYTASGLVIGIAGKYRPSFLDSLKKDAGKFPQKSPPSTSPGKPLFFNGGRLTVITRKDVPGAAISIGAVLPVTRKDDDFAALMVANSWFGEHRKSYSHLYQKIRSQRSMNYGDYSYIEYYHQGGSNMLPTPGFPRSNNYFSIWLRPVQTAKSLKSQYPEFDSLQTGHAHFAIRMALKEHLALVKNGLSKEDFELTRQFLRSYLKLYAQTPEKQLGFLLDSRFYGRKDYLKEMDSLLEKLTLEEVNAAIKKYLDINVWTIVIVTDESEGEMLAKSIVENKPSPMVYPEVLRSVLPGEILSEDKQTENFPFFIKFSKVIPHTDPFK